jgi:hypothetical protein
VRLTGRQSVDQFVLVSDIPLEPLTRFYLFLFVRQLLICFSETLSPTRGVICDVLVKFSDTAGFKSGITDDTIMLSLVRPSNFFASYNLPRLRWKYFDPFPQREGFYGMCVCVCVDYIRSKVQCFTPSPIVQLHTLDSLFLSILLMHSSDARSESQPTIVFP